MGSSLSPADISVFAMLVRLQREIPGALEYFPSLLSFSSRMKLEQFFESTDSGDEQKQSGTDGSSSMP